MNNSFCALLWQRLTHAADGTLKPCCRFQAQAGQNFPRPGARSAEMLAAFNAPVFQTIRRQMIAGEVVAGCAKCNQQERVGAKSMRQAVPENLFTGFPYSDEVHPAQITSVEVFLGRECNLRCRMCGPALSSSWDKDGFAVGMKSAREVAFDLEALRPLAPQLREVKILGGEPLLSPHHQPLLEMLCEDGVPEKIKLEYDTNVTVFPRAEVIERWSQFRRVHLGLSVDGYGEVNHLIRYPTNWDVVVRHLHRYFELAERLEGLHLLLGTTVNVYNVFDLPRLLAWWNDIKPAPIRARVREIVSATVYPEHLDIRILPQAMKQRVMKLYAHTIGSKYAGLIDHMLSADREELIPRFLAYTRELDRRRGQDTAALLPELQELFAARPLTSDPIAANSVEVRE